MNKNIVFLALIFFFSLSVKAQEEGEKEANPKLVVGIVVDQMRYDYLMRFYNKFGEGGFKRMMREGFNCKNNHFKKPL